jgi:hypothetical protein
VQWLLELTLKDLLCGRTVYKFSAKRVGESISHSDIRCKRETALYPLACHMTTCQVGSAHHVVGTDRLAWLGQRRTVLNWATRCTLIDKLPDISVVLLALTCCVHERSPRLEIRPLRRYSITVTNRSRPRNNCHYVKRCPT